MNLKDINKTIKLPTTEVLYKDKNSKFYGYAFPVSNEADANYCIKALKKQHHSARHWCYAYRIGAETIVYRVNDDGEPNNSAGQPIYGQIQSFGLTNVLVVVVRYFGGVKLGVGGLINAYKTTAKRVLENSKISVKTININFLLSFDYLILNKVMRIIKEKQLLIVNQDLELICKIEISVRKNNSEQIFKLFNNFFGVEIKKLNV